MHDHDKGIAPRRNPHVLKRPPHNSAEMGLLVQIGAEVFPVYGNDQLGWSMDRGDLCFDAAEPFRYHSLEELLFALMNLSIAPDGSA